MALLYTPQKSSEPPSRGAAALPVSENLCFVCKENIVETQDILIITTCSHEFHRNCIENALSQSAECPQCKCACELGDLQSKRNDIQLFRNSPKPKQTNIGRSKPRGAMAKKHFTRNQAKNLGQEYSQQTSLDLITSNILLETDDRNISPQQEQQSGRVENNFIEQLNQPANSSQVTNNIDFSQINQIIESTVTRLLANLNIASNSGNQGQNIQNNMRSQQQTPAFYNNQYSQQQQQQPRSNISGTQFIDSNYSLRADKVTAIIQNWNIKFDGSTNGLTVGEFLYRVRSLTSENFNGDFSIICKYLPMLLTGKAKDWYWRYHKQVDRIEWNDFCAALKYQYKDFKSNFDVREEVRNRKMKAGETFEVFYESICSMLDRLDTPIPETELVEILTKNLRPEIRHELLYVPIYSIAHLRKLVQMRENMLADNYFRHHATTKSAPVNTMRRAVAELDFEENKTENPSIDYDHLVNEIRQGQNVTKCWNCEEIGHHWEDCIKERIVFCYGCGRKNIYKPQCSRCLNKNVSNSKN